MPLPFNERRTIAVIGAGIVGVSAAIWLLRDGHDVVLIDRLGPAKGTSYGNAGVLAACSIIPVTVPGLVGKAPGMLLDAQSPLFMRWSYLPKLAPWLTKYLSHCNEDDVRRIAKALAFIARDSLEQHQALADGTGAEKWLEPSDYVFLYNDRDHFAKDRFGFEIRQELGYEWQELEAREIKEYDPVYGDKFGLATRFGDHGHIRDPGLYVSDLADHAVAKGARLVTSEVKDIVIENSRAVAVSTDDGPIACDDIVLATGVWSGPLAQKLGINVPLESERGYHIEFINPDRLPRAPVMVASAKVAITPMAGRIRCAGIVEFGGLEAGPQDSPVALIKKRMLDLFKGIQFDRIDEWMGHRPAPADSIPVIGEFKKARGVYGGFGHHHIGLTCGPKTGRLIADLIAGRIEHKALAAYSPERFAV